MSNRMHTCANCENTYNKRINNYCPACGGAEVVEDE